MLVAYFCLILSGSDFLWSACACACAYVVVGLSSSDLSCEYFGRRFHQQPIAFFDIPEPSNTGKALLEFFQDIRSLGTRGLYIYKSPDETFLHKVFLKGHLADGVAR